MRILVVLLFIFWPFVSFSFPVTVRSGEHGDFSRLVFYAPSHVDFLVETRSGVVKLSFSDLPSSVDYSGIFDFIPRSRIDRVEWVGLEFNIFLNCECSFELNSIQPGISFVDIFDSAPVLLSVDEELAEGGRVMMPLVGEESVELMMSMLGREVFFEPVEVENSQLEYINTSVNYDGGSGWAELDALKAMSRGISLYQLSRSIEASDFMASQGQKMRVSDSNPQREFVGFVESRLGVVEPSVIRQESCFSSAAKGVLDFSDFSGEPQISLGEVRQKAISGDFLFARAGLLYLSRKYISLGFIDEAIQTLYMVEDGLDRAVVFEFVSFLNGEGVSEGGSISSIKSCDDAAGAWYLLGSEQSSVEGTSAEGDVSRFFDSQPPALKAILLDRVEKRMLDLNLEDGVSFLNRAMDLSSDKSEEKTTRVQGVRLSDSEVPFLTGSQTKTARDDVDLQSSRETLDVSGRLNIEALAHIMTGLEEEVSFRSEIMNQFLADANWLAALNSVSDAFSSSGMSSNAVTSMEDTFSRAVLNNASDGELLALFSRPDFVTIVERVGGDLSSDLNSRFEKLMGVLGGSSAVAENQVGPTVVAPVTVEGGDDEFTNDAVVVGPPGPWEPFLEILSDSEALRSEISSLIQ